MTSACNKFFGGRTGETDDFGIWQIYLSSYLFDIYDNIYMHIYIYISYYVYYEIHQHRINTYVYNSLHFVYKKGKSTQKSWFSPHLDSGPTPRHLSLLVVASSLPPGESRSRFS